MKSKFHIFLTLSIFYALLLWGFDAPVWSFLMLIVVFIAVLIVGVSIPKWSFFGKVIARSNDGICLTFDDGPNAQWTPQFLNLLDQYQIKGSFFVIGQQIAQGKECLVQMKQAGHFIGNHSYHHDWKGSLYFSKAYMEEVLKTDGLLKDLGIENQAYRPPFGVITPHIAKACQLLNKKIVGWDVRPKDTQVKSAEQIFKTMDKAVQKGRRLILLHDQNEYTFNALKLFLEKYQDQRFCTVEELL